MTKEEYIDVLARQEFFDSLTTTMMCNELHSMALAEVLMKKGLFTYTELQVAFRHQIRLFIERNLEGCDESIFTE